MSIKELLDTFKLLVHIAAVGQVVFVVMWATLPWWRSWVGKALMVKSFGFMVVLLTQVWFYHNVPSSVTVTVQIAIAVFGLVTIGIWAQVFALGHEIYQARKAKRQVSGTHERDSLSGRR